MVEREHVPQTARSHGHFMAPATALDGSNLSNTTYPTPPGGARSLPPKALKTTHFHTVALNRLLPRGVVCLAVPDVSICSAPVAVLRTLTVREVLVGGVLGGKRLRLRDYDRDRCVVERCGYSDTKSRTT